MRVGYPICSFFDQYTVKDYLDYFHLGKSKMEEVRNQIWVNQIAADFQTVLKEGDLLEINYQEEIDFLPDKVKLSIVYEDAYFLIVNKPIHKLVHPDDKTKKGTMCNIVSQYYHYKNLQLSVKYAHRLDVDTTGLLIFVKDALVHAKVDQMISDHTLKRTYLCLVSGHLQHKTGTIDAPIGKDRHHNQRRRVSKTGKTAITTYEVVKEWKGYSLLRVVLQTGRTHQIRVHLSSIGHPLLGDALYGGSMKLASRPLLHSFQIELLHPVTQKKLIVEKKVPFDMEKLMKEGGR